MAVPFTFVNYDRITDNLLWLGRTGNGESVYLKFVVDLVKLDQYNNERHFHSESKFYSKKLQRNSQSITRNYNCYFVLNAGMDNIGCILRPSDVQLLNMLIDSNIMPWFMGETRIFGMKGDTMRVLGNYMEQTIPLNERSYIKFIPVVITFEDTNSYKEGIRLELNDRNTCVDLTIDKFLELVYILRNTDMINLAAAMINYVKIPPYNINIRGEGGSYSGSGKVGNFFDK